MWKTFLKWLKDVLTPKPIIIPEPKPTQSIVAVSWELPCNDSQVIQGAHPECAAWSAYAYAQIMNNYAMFMQAKDLELIIPEFKSLNADQITWKFVELLSAIAKFECSWNPKDQAKDVNGSSDPAQMATGLFQLNEEDQKNYKTGTSFTWQELEDPFNNIKAAVGILVTMIKIRGKITKAPGDAGHAVSEFFETLIFGAKYENVQTILKMVAELKFSQVTKVPDSVTKPVISNTSSTPWVDWFIARKGWTEFDHDAELSKGWKYTNVPEYKTVIGANYAWCAQALNTALEINGYKGTKDASAISFQYYGNACSYLIGAIAVIQHVSGAHHVTTFAGWKDQTNKIGYFLGGNQQNSICVAEYNVSGNANGHDEIIALRWPIK